ncbi:MAG: hypothetical protein ACT4QF_02395 [Sporichthyaceae bacterium]
MPGPPPAVERCLRTGAARKPHTSGADVLLGSALGKREAARDWTFRR